MKCPRVFSLLAIMLLACSVMSLPACSVGQKARNAATSVLDNMDGNVERDVRTGIEILSVTDPLFNSVVASRQADEFFTATSSRDREQIASVFAYWRGLKEYADRGFNLRIGMGEIGEGVAESKRVRLDEFEHLLTRIIQNE